jgi:hypothetical protein
MLLLPDECTPAQSVLRTLRQGTLSGHTDAVPATFEPRKARASFDWRTDELTPQLQLPHLRIELVEYRGPRAIRRANFGLRLSFLANYIQKMVKICLNYY